MPEMHFLVRWPDGSTESCYSPSLIIKDYFAPGQAYPVPEFLRLAQEALAIASERVRAKYGFACTSAAAQLATIEARCSRFLDEPGATVAVESFQE